MVLTRRQQKDATAKETVAKGKMTRSGAPPAGRGDRWPSTFGVMGDVVYSLGKDLPKDPQGKSKVFSCWYLSPDQTALEILINIIWGASFLWNGACLKEWGSDNIKVEATRPLDVYDTVFGWVCVLHATKIVHSKWTRNRMAFMLQPCNIFIVLLSYISFSRTSFAVQCFNFYLHMQWGSWLGVLAADLRDYHSKLEIGVFFTMHFVLILFPWYHLYRNTFPVLAEDTYSVFCITSMQHYLFYLPFSLITGWQVQYMTFPPKQLNFAGRGYRVSMALFHYPVTKLTAAVIVPFFRTWVSGYE